MFKFKRKKPSEIIATMTTAVVESFRKRYKIVVVTSFTEGGVVNEIRLERTRVPTEDIDEAAEAD